MDGGWSVAWRVHDAQYYGIPQRRKRIALVADFGGGSAPEILFERKSVSGDFEPGKETRKDPASSSGESAFAAIENGLTGKHDGSPATGRGSGENVVTYGIGSYGSNAWKSGNPKSGIYEADVAKTIDLIGGGRPDCHQGGIAVVTLEGNGSRPSHGGDGYAESDVEYTLNGTEVHGVCSCSVKAERER